VSKFGVRESPLIHEEEDMKKGSAGSWMRTLVGDAFEVRGPQGREKGGCKKQPTEDDADDTSDK